jgi:hypothetical protein
LQKYYFEIYPYFKNVYSGLIEGNISTDKVKSSPKNIQLSQAPVAHAYNPSYSGSKDQENLGSKPAWANSLGVPILKNIHHKKGLAEWLKVQALSSSPVQKKN